jgi:hypothetical protein
MIYSGRKCVAGYRTVRGVHCYRHLVLRHSGIMAACLVLSYSVTHSLTPHSTVLPEKLTGLQVVKKFPEDYGTGMFITTFPT